MNKDYSEHVSALFSWYDANRRDLPWRSDRDPYKSWISEVMLQQTRVSTVIPYFNRFVQTYPDIPTLAVANPDSVYKSWEGLGYYSRARNLIAGSRYIVENHGGVFPRRKNEILCIPGIGPYIAAAILSMAFGDPEPSVDGNLIRVISRLHALSGPADSGVTRKHITSLAREMISDKRPGDFNEAMMDVGATICTPKSPSCETCPFQSLCLAARDGNWERYPGPKKSSSVPSVSLTICAVILDGRVLIRKRPETGLLAGLYEFFSFPGHLSEAEALRAVFSSITLSNKTTALVEALPKAQHRFSHLIWDMQGYRVVLEKNRTGAPVCFSLSDADAETGCFHTPVDARKLAFPTALRVYTEAVLGLKHDVKK